MANMVDYIVWRGDIPISKEFPFNQIDSMILARFSYLMFEKIDLKTSETVGSVCIKMLDFGEDEFKISGDKYLVEEICKSKRFKNLMVTDFVQNSDIETEKQFSAITIHISEDEMYVSFEGTDKTINGWKEDFNLGFMEFVPAQVEGSKYLNTILSKYPRKRARIGGHSKGGNIAIYSSITLPHNLHDRVIEVNNFDGPGFCKKIIEKYEKEKMWNKITTFIPQDSVIGRLLDHKEKCIIVYSTEKGIHQHDIYSWQVIANKPVTLNEVTDSSELINSALTEWLENTKPEQRKFFIDQIFEILYSVDVTSTIDIKSTLIRKIPDLIKAYKGVSEEDRKSIGEMVKIFVKSYVSKIKENEIAKFNRLQNTIETKTLNSGNDQVQ